MWLGVTTLATAVLDLALLFSENHWPSQSVPNRATQLCLASGPLLLTSPHTGGSQVKLSFDFWTSAGLSLLSQPHHFPFSLGCQPALRSPLSLGHQGWSATRLFILTAAFLQASSPRLLHQKPPNERASCFSWRDLPVLSLDLARLKSDFISPCSKTSSITPLPAGEGPKLVALAQERPFANWSCALSPSATWRQPI